MNSYLHHQVTALDLSYWGKFRLQLEDAMVLLGLPCAQEGNNRSKWEPDKVGD